MTEKASRGEEELVAQLRSGDRAAFTALVDDMHGRLLGLAATFTSSSALAEDIVQETWLGVIAGLHGFEGRSALRTWIYSILVRRARTVTSREARRGEVPFPVANPEAEEWNPGQGRRGLWEEPPVPWGLEDPDTALGMRETLAVVERALGGLPESQRQVVLLRDVEDVPAVDVCNILGLSETNQRVLLHRGRAGIRRVLDQYLRGGSDRRERAPATGGATATRPALP